jgi:hypothetical protein
MSWKDDRDTLIAQTMAFVQSVTSRRQGTPDIAVKLARLSAVEAQDPDSVSTEMKPFATARMAEPPPAVATPAPAPRPVAPGEMASEIRARIAGFRAHQERFNREREEYFSTTIARLRATLNGVSPPRSEE